MNQDITQKTYKKLCFEVSYSDLSFCVIDLISNKIITYKSYSINKNNVLEEELWKIFVENPILDDKYDDVVVLHNSNLNTLVPSSLLENTIPDDAIQLFHKWFYEAEEQEDGEVNAMTVSSIGLDLSLIHI